MSMLLLQRGVPLVYYLFLSMRYACRGVFRGDFDVFFGTSNPRPIALECVYSRSGKGKEMKEKAGSDYFLSFSLSNSFALRVSPGYKSAGIAFAPSTFAILNLAHLV